MRHRLFSRRPVFPGCGATAPRRARPTLAPAGAGIRSPIMLANAEQPKSGEDCPPTESDALGPLYKPGASERASAAVGVGLGIIFHERTWCYICPIGTMSNWVCKNRRPLTISAERCTQCNLCAPNCPMQLSPAAIKEQSSMPNGGDCLKCRVCVESCRKAALAFQGGSLGREAA